MTETEAKTKWCPMVLYDQGRPLNRDACYHGAGTHCIGSECMMWRWASIDMDEDDYARLSAEGKLRGYCGLAGKPLG